MKKPFMMAITGGSGAGKSTVVDLLRHACPASQVGIVNLDQYYKDSSYIAEKDRGSINFDHPDAVDGALFCEHVEALAQGEGVKRPTYDFITHGRTQERVEILASPVILVEGLFVLHFERIRALFDLKVYLEVSSDVRLVRRLERDVATRGRTMDNVISQYLATVRPMQQKYIEPCKQYADLLVAWEERNPTTIEMLAAILIGRTG